MLVALIQTQIYDYDTQKNLKNLTDITNNLSKDTDWVIFPEMFLTGFVTDTSLCEKSQTDGLSFLRELAKKFSCAAEGSLFIQENGKYLNRHYFITPAAEDYYDKNKLFSLSDEAKILTNGTKPSIVNYNGWKINLKTCYDVRFCDICKNNFMGGEFMYDVMTFVASWPSNRSSQWKILLQARARENMSYVIGVNRCGTDSSGLLYSGDSCIVNTKGEFLEKLPESTADIHYYNIDKDYLDKQRKKFPVHKDWQDIQR